MSLTRSELITAGVLRERCAEVIDRIKCLGVCGETFLAADWAAAAACPVCAAEKHRYICARCDHLFDEPVLSTEHPCGSVAVYDAKSRVVFEEEMQAVLKAAELASKEARRRDLKRKTKEDAKRRDRSGAEALALAETKRRADAEKARRAREADDRRRAKERLAFERRIELEREREAEARRLAEASPKRTKLDEAREAVDETIRRQPRRRAIAFSAISAAIGSWMAWTENLIPLADRGLIALIFFLIITYVIWRVGNLPILKRYPGPDNLNKLSFLIWAFVSYTWPPFLALILLKFIDYQLNFAGFTRSYIENSSSIIIFSIMGLFIMQRGGAALSMSPPWPPIIPENFKGRRSFWVWIGLIMTFFLNLANLQGRTIYHFEDKTIKHREDLIVTATVLNCREKPAIDAISLSTLVNGQIVKVAQRERVDGWVKLDIDSGQCWAKEVYLRSAEPIVEEESSAVGRQSNFDATASEQDRASKEGAAWDSNEAQLEAAVTAAEAAAAEAEAAANELF